MTKENSETLCTVCVKKDVAYLAADRSEKMDLYLPVTDNRDKKFPAIVLIHGGGWSKLDKAHAREISIANTLASNGFVVASINYKLTTDSEKAWPTNIADCKTAIRFLRKYAAEYNIDALRMATMGSSAGAHLALLAAYTGDNGVVFAGDMYSEYSDAVMATISFYGPTDVHYGLMPGMSPCGELFLPADSRYDSEIYDFASPAYWALSFSLPTLLIHGTNDKIVSIEHSERFAEILDRQGIIHEYIHVEGAGHSFNLTPPQKDLRQIVLDFLTKYLAVPN